MTGFVAETYYPGPVFIDDSFESWLRADDVENLTSFNRESERVYGFFLKISGDYSELASVYGGLSSDGEIPVDIRNRLLDLRGQALMVSNAFTDLANYSSGMFIDAEGMRLHIPNDQERIWLEIFAGRSFYDLSEGDKEALRLAGYDHDLLGEWYEYSYDLQRRALLLEEKFNGYVAAAERAKQALNQLSGLVTPAEALSFLQKAVALVAGSAALVAALASGSGEAAFLAGLGLALTVSDTNFPLILNEKDLIVEVLNRVSSDISKDVNYSIADKIFTDTGLIPLSASAPLSESLGSVLGILNDTLYVLPVSAGLKKVDFHTLDYSIFAQGVFVLGSHLDDIIYVDETFAHGVEVRALGGDNTVFAVSDDFGSIFSDVIVTSEGGADLIEVQGAFLDVSSGGGNDTINILAADAGHVLAGGGDDLVRVGYDSGVTLDGGDGFDTLDQSDITGLLLESRTSKTNRVSLPYFGGTTTTRLLDGSYEFSLGSERTISFSNFEKFIGGGLNDSFMDLTGPIVVGAGLQTVELGLGDDRFALVSPASLILNGGAGDHFDWFADGIDTLSYHGNEPLDVRFSKFGHPGLVQVAIEVSEGEKTDRLYSIERLHLSSGSDTVFLDNLNLLKNFGVLERSDPEKYIQIFGDSIEKVEADEKAVDVVNLQALGPNGGGRQLACSMVASQ